MANFPPFKNYIIYILDKAAEECKFLPPFLDVGTGVGDVARYFALKGWDGKAIDLSETALTKAKINLAQFKDVRVEKKSLFQEAGTFNTIFLFDVLEHIDEDEAALKKIHSLLNKAGYLIATVPSKPSEWSWDDDFYGHLRRYTVEEIENKLRMAGLELVFCWDISFPVFWIFRRMYTLIKPVPAAIKNMDKLTRTKQSTSINAWEMPFISNILVKNYVFWKMVYRFQFKFKDKVHRGCELFILARSK